MTGEPGNQEMQLTWTETDGPPPQQGNAPGFGTTVVEKHTALSLGGVVKLDLTDTGLVWELKAPSASVLWQRDATAKSGSA